MAEHRSQTTIDHDTIRQWAEARDGAPATVSATMDGAEPGVLRLDFPGYSGEDTLEHVDWDAWFAKFDAEKLAFLYQDKTAGGQTSRFFKLVRRTAEHEQAANDDALKRGRARNDDANDQANDDAPRRGRARKDNADHDPTDAVTTTDHDAIRAWAEARDAEPATVTDTMDGDAPGILVLDFPGYQGPEGLTHIDWDAWFAKFDADGLALLHQEQTAKGKRSNFNRLVNRG